MLTIDSKSNPVYEFPVEFTDGAMELDRERFKHETKGLQGSYILALRKPTKKRSLRQNRVQWWYFTEIAKETGHTPNDIKGMMQVKFLMRTIIDSKGKVEPYVLGTSDLTTLEHNDFCEDIRNWAGQFLNMKLDLPNEFLFDEI